MITVKEIARPGWTEVDFSLKETVMAHAAKPSRAQSMLDQMGDYTLTDFAPISAIRTAGYCRPVSKARVKSLVANFNSRALGVVILSLQRDGGYHILDGSHRAAAAKEKGLTHIPAQVFIDLTYEEEAELFTLLNTVNASSPLDRFRSAFEAKDAQSVNIMRLVQSIGMSIPIGGEYKTPNTPNTIPAIGSLIQLYEDLGPDLFLSAIQVLHQAWGNDHHAWKYGMLQGMRQFWVRYHDKVNRTELITRMRNKMPQRILAECASLSGRLHTSTAVGQSLVDIYNKGRQSRNRLPDWDSFKHGGRNQPMYPGVGSMVTRGTLRNRPS